jgi:hypothetical protein
VRLGRRLEPEDDVTDTDTADAELVRSFWKALALATSTRSAPTWHPTATTSTWP